jgi:hypothetical protein
MNEFPDQLKQPDLIVADDAVSSEPDALEKSSPPPDAALAAPVPGRSPSFGKKLLLVAALPLLVFLTVGVFTLNYDSRVPFIEQYLREGINISYMQEVRKSLDMAEPLPAKWRHWTFGGSPTLVQGDFTKSRKSVQIAFGPNSHNRTGRQMLESFIARKKEIWAPPGHIDSNLFTRTIGGQEFVMVRASHRIDDNQPVCNQFGFASLPDGRAAVVLLATRGDSFDQAAIDEVLAHIKGIKRSEKPVESSPLTKHYFDE